MSSTQPLLGLATDTSEEPSWFPREISPVPPPPSYKNSNQIAKYVGPAVEGALRDASLPRCVCQATVRPGAAERSARDRRSPQTPVGADPVPNTFRQSGPSDSGQGRLQSQTPQILRLISFDFIYLKSHTQVIPICCGPHSFQTFTPHK